MFLVCFCRASGFCRKDAWDVCVLEEADRELIVKEIDRFFEGIIHESWSRWEGEARGRQLSKHKEACPKDTRRTASRKRKVDRGSQPPPEGQHHGGSGIDHWWSS